MVPSVAKGQETEVVERIAYRGVMVATRANTESRHISKLLLEVVQHPVIEVVCRQTRQIEARGTHNQGSVEK
jgi:hypothetical protein